MLECEEHKITTLPIEWIIIQLKNGLILIP